MFSGQMAEVGRLAAQEDAVMTLPSTKPGDRLCDGYATHADLASYSPRDSQVLPSNVLDARIRGQGTAAVKNGGSAHEQQRVALVEKPFEPGPGRDRLRGSLGDRPIFMGYTPPSGRWV